MKKYNSPVLEIVEAPEIVKTSSEVETDKVPLTITSANNYDNYQL